jgi:hypothetical protein
VHAIIDQGLEIKLIENTIYVCKNGGLVTPTPLQVRAVKWYHHYLQPPGHTCLKETMNAAMYWKGMRTTIWLLTKSCRSCQINKRLNLKYGRLPPKTNITNPWECLCANHIGPYTLKGKDNLQIDFMALTMMDPTFSWFEIAELRVVTQLRRQTINGKELLIANKIFDKTNRSEFKLYFKYLCKSYGIKRKPITVKNPQANCILESLHQVLRQMLRPSEINMADSVTPNDVDIFLDNVAWAICSTYHTVLKASPGAAIFGRDMLFDIPFMADWHKFEKQTE